MIQIARPRLAAYPETTGWRLPARFAGLAGMPMADRGTQMLKETLRVPNIMWFEQIKLENIHEVGGKNASLGELISHLSDKGVRIPAGFATTASAYRSFLLQNNLEQVLHEKIAAFRTGGSDLQTTGKAIRDLIMAGHLSDELAQDIAGAYQELASHAGLAKPAVAVRSSATAEDLPDASFAGQLETFLNVVGIDDVKVCCLQCFASLFTDRAIAYREAKGFDHLTVGLSVGIQLMVRSDLAGSGVMFSIDPETGFPRAIVISAAFGLGETVVQGAVDPDQYTVFKPLLEDMAFRPIIEKSLGAKEIKMIYSQGGTWRTWVSETTPAERKSWVLDDAEILQLARWGRLVEHHYGRPMDIEWAKDGESGDLFLVQARPETVQSNRQPTTLRRYSLKEDATAALTGEAVGTAIAAGPVRVVRSNDDIAGFPQGAILVAANTDPDWMPAMRKAAGIVTDHGGSTSHAAIVSRELGIPAVIGTGDATRTLFDGGDVTICCAGGNRGQVYLGRHDFVSEVIELGDLPKTRTQVMVNLADPSAAFQWWQLPARGVGLARMEFIVNALIKVHPMALLHPERLDEETRKRIAGMTEGHSSPSDFFIDLLSQGIAKLAAAYHPHPAIVRLSDFKTNEYSHLIGGEPFEPAEENPMLGFRGASRYYHPLYREAFALECQALRRVRDEMGFSNLVAMVPFCRTPAEADRVLAELARNGLRRHQNGLEVFMMCEIPSNVVLAHEFAKRFDGFSIGSNDLTQLVLGIDRDSELLSGLFDERNEAVTTMVEQAISQAHAGGIKIGLCGQAPSDHPDFAQFLVRKGIDSISLNPDSFVATLRSVAAAEAGLAVSRPEITTRSHTHKQDSQSGGDLIHSLRRRLIWRGSI